MRLAEFIAGNMERILAEWEAFAATRSPAADHMAALALRDHAPQILEAIVRDLQTPQSDEEQLDKSHGEAAAPAVAPITAAETHAVLRARHGFDINQLAAEYRALRASVLRLWLEGDSESHTHLRDIVRFNEGIDQALAESIRLFDLEVERSRNLLLGMLGHDLRSPLQSIRFTAAALSRLDTGAQVSGAVSLLIRSGERMQSLLDDLVDFNRSRLGLGIQLRTADTDLTQVFADEIEQLRAAFPGRDLQMAAHGDTRICGDARRLQQVLANLVSNAVKHGSSDAPVLLSVIGHSDCVEFSVGNAGAAIAEAHLARIFEPMQRCDSASASEGMGLGLFIASEMVNAHRGQIAVRSDDAATVFSVRLPRLQE